MPRSFAAYPDDISGHNHRTDADGSQAWRGQRILRPTGPRADWRSLAFSCTYDIPGSSRILNGLQESSAASLTKGEADAGKTIFYEFYTERQKQEDPAKRLTGLFFFRGKPGAPFAIVCPGGGFSYVGSLHEGFPLAREISRKGFNAFVIRYRVDERGATEDLAAAVSYVFRNAERLGVGTRGYSLWGCSAGARMVGNIALRGVAGYGGDDLPRPAAAVIAYTGPSGVSGDFPPTFINVSEYDRIVNAATVEQRVRDLRKAGVEVEFHKYKSVGHGFGLGVGTEAEGWIGQAAAFWTSHMPK